MDNSRLTFGQQWAIAFGGSCITWFIAVSFASAMPAPAQILTMLLPVAGFGYSAWLTPQWKKQGIQATYAESLTERRQVQALANQYQFDMAAIDAEHQARMKSLFELYQDPEPAQSVQVTIPLEDQAKAIAGDYGHRLMVYMLTKAPTDADGWIAVEKLRSNWAKNNNMTKPQLVDLLTLLTQNQLGEFKDSDCTEWRAV